MKTQPNSNYAAVLRTRPAEIKAIANLTEGDAQRLYPLIEVVPQIFDIPETPKAKQERKEQRLLELPGLRDLNNERRKPISPVVREWAGRLIEANPGGGTFGLSVDPLGKSPDAGRILLEFCELVSHAGMAPIPTTGLGTAIEIQTAVRNFHREHGAGAVMRVSSTDLLGARIPERISRVTDFLEIGYEDIDLLVDLGSIFESAPPPLEDILVRVPDLHRWRRCIALAGAFPLDLQGYTPGTVRTIPRRDLAWWRAGVATGALPRNPVFGDYTSQFGRYMLPPRNGFAKGSRSLKYATPDDWVISRGSSKVTSKYDYSWGARALAGREDFNTSTFSWGSSVLNELAVGDRKTIDAKTATAACINQHIVVTLRALANQGLPPQPMRTAPTPSELLPA